MKNVAGEDPNFYKTSKFDLILIALIILVSVFSLLRITQNRIRQSAQPRIAVIYQNSRWLENVDLRKDSLFAILNGRMRVEIKGGKIRIRDADCPHHLCINMGWIQYSGQTIVCVPNQVLIEIKSTAPQLLDAVVY